MTDGAPKWKTLVEKRTAAPLSPCRAAAVQTCRRVLCPLPLGPRSPRPSPARLATGLQRKLAQGWGSPGLSFTAPVVVTVTRMKFRPSGAPPRPRGGPCLDSPGRSSGELPLAATPAAAPLSPGDCRGEEGREARPGGAQQPPARQHLHGRTHHGDLWGAPGCACFGVRRRGCESCCRVLDEWKRFAFTFRTWSASVAFN